MLLAGLLGVLPDLRGLILVGHGNQPVRDAGWPAGALELANLGNRLGWTEGPPFGGGQWTFYYRGDTNALGKALDLFASIQAERLEIVLHDGVPRSSFLPGGEDKDDRYDWSFEVWVPEHWRQLFNNPESYFGSDRPNFRQPLAPPRLDVWLSSGRLAWRPVALPLHVTIRDARASAHGYADGSAVEATITDARTAQPLANARLVAVATESKDAPARKTSATADRAGRARMPRLAPGSYRWVVEADGYVSRALGYARVDTNDFLEYAAALLPPATLEGRVVDETGQPLAKVAVKPSVALGPDGLGYPMAETPTGETDAQGRFELKALPVGSIQLRAERAGYLQKWEPTELIPVGQGTNAVAAECVVRLEATGTLRVRLVDRQGRPAEPLPGETVQIHVESERGAVPGTWGGSANVETNGCVEFRGVPPGRYRVSDKPFLPGEAKRSVKVTVESRKTVALDWVRGRP